MSEQRFHNKLGEEYELFQLVLPHYNDLQNSVGNLIKENFVNSNLNKIEVLEIGFGSGVTSKVILSSDNRVYLTAIDDEPIMLSKAVENLEQFDKSRFNLQIVDALKFLEKTGDNSFDAIASAWVLHNFTKEYRSKVLNEIYRVIKPGSIFINADKIEVTDRKEHQKNMEWQLSQFEIFEKNGRPELKKEWTDHYFEDGKPERVLIENEFISEIKQIGFKSIDILKRWHDDAAAIIKK